MINNCHSKVKILPVQICSGASVQQRGGQTSFDQTDSAPTDTVWGVTRHPTNNKKRELLSTERLKRQSWCQNKSAVHVTCLGKGKVNVVVAVREFRSSLTGWFLWICLHQQGWQKEQSNNVVSVLFLLSLSSWLGSVLRLFFLLLPCDATVLSSLQLLGPSCHSRGHISASTNVFYSQ